MKELLKQIKAHIITIPITLSVWLLADLGERLWPILSVALGTVLNQTILLRTTCLLAIALLMVFAYAFALNRKLKAKLRLKFFMKWDRGKNPYCHVCDQPLTYNEANKKERLYCERCQQDRQPRDEENQVLTLAEARRRL